MKLTAAIGVALAILAVEVAVIGLLMREPAFPPNGRSALEGYLSFERAAYANELSLTQAVRTKKPWLFTPDMSAGTFGDSTYYRTSHSYRMPTPTLDFGSGRVIPGLGDPSRPLSSLRPARPLPYPPEEVWCVVLRNRDSKSSVVFVAFHADLYNADWIVHEANGTPPDPGLSKATSAIGCDLKLGNDRD
jgi:hypothetical protein